MTSRMYAKNNVTPTSVQNVTSVFRLTYGEVVDHTTATNVTVDAAIGPFLPLGWRVVLSIVLAVIMTFAVFGNLLVIVVVARNRGMRTRTNLFLCNLAVSDFLCAIVDMPFSLVTVASDKWLFNDSICKLNGFAMPFFFVASIHTLMHMAVFKYLSIVRPFNRLATAGVPAMITASWLWAFLAAGLTVSPLTEISYKNLTTQCGPAYPRTPSQYTHFGFFFVTCYTIPLVVVVVCYARTFRAIRDYGSRIRRTTTEAVTLVYARQRRVAVTLLAVVLTFFISWTPWSVYAACTIFLQQIGPFANPLTYWSGYFSTACNPIIYALRSEAFREGYKLIIASAAGKANSRTRRRTAQFSHQKRHWRPHQSNIKSNRPCVEQIGHRYLDEANMLVPRCSSIPVATAATAAAAALAAATAVSTQKRTSRTGYVRPSSMPPRNSADVDTVTNLPVIIAGQTFNDSGDNEIENCHDGSLKREELTVWNFNNGFPYIGVQSADGETVQQQQEHYYNIDNCSEGDASCNDLTPTSAYREQHQLVAEEQNLGQLRGRAFSCDHDSTSSGKDRRLVTLEQAPKSATLRPPGSVDAAYGRCHCTLPFGPKSHSDADLHSTVSDSRAGQSQALDATVDASTSSTNFARNLFGKLFPGGTARGRRRGQSVNGELNSNEPDVPKQDDSTNDVIRRKSGTRNRGENCFNDQTGSCFNEISTVSNSSRRPTYSKNLTPFSKPTPHQLHHQRQSHQLRQVDDEDVRGSNHPRHDICEPPAITSADKRFDVVETLPSAKRKSMALNNKPSRSSSTVALCRCPSLEKLDFVTDELRRGCGSDRRRPAVESRFVKR